MSKEENLKPINQTSEEAKKNGRKGGINSGKSRKAKKLLRDELIALLETKISNDEGKKITTRKKISLALIQKASNGDVKAFEVIRDTIGEKPIEKQELTIDPPQIIDDIQ